MRWASILFIWEFVGIDLEKAKDAEGYAGALVRSLKSPQAVPWILLALVFCFLEMRALAGSTGQSDWVIRVRICLCEDNSRVGASPLAPPRC